MTDFQEKTVFITGGSRGIGKAIALKLAKAGANIVVASKTDTPSPKLEGTIHTAAEEIEAAGSGKALGVVMDVRNENAVCAGIEKTVQTFGGIDILVNNASAIQLTNTETLEMKRYDLMQDVNTRGTFLTTKLALPYLKKSSNAHVLMLSPPLDMQTHWFAPHVGYSIAKYGMSLCVLGFAGEFKKYGIAVNALWPRTTIATAAVSNIVGGEAMMQASRKSDIMADAAFEIFKRDSKVFSGNFLIDDSVLYEAGIRDFDVYRVDPTKALQPDFFVPSENIAPVSLSAQKVSE